jgi:hypothetical protein
MRFPWLPWWSFCAVAAIFIAAQLHAQPDPRQMAGIPRPVDDLPNGSVSVRVIRGALTNNIPNQAVQLQVGTDIRTAQTDAEGRAQFDALPAGVTLRAVAIVDGERLESEPFPAPGQGGIRLLLVATSGAADSPAVPTAPAITGTVSIGGQTRVIIQPGDENVTLYYLLELVNNSASPVNPATPFDFEMPAGSTGTGILQGSSPLAAVNGSRVIVSGPIPPGRTLVQVGTQITTTSGSLNLTQRFPGALDEFALIVKKVGDMKVASPQITEQREIAAQGEIFIAASGAPVAAGQPLNVSVTGMPHHSPMPRYTALTLAVGILIAGIWAGWRARDETGANASERKRLVARREKLLNELARLDRDDRASPRYSARREEILSALEPIYGALDYDTHGPGAGSTAGVTA